jgi:hypothetical protein
MQWQPAPGSASPSSVHRRNSSILCFDIQGPVHHAQLLGDATAWSLVSMTKRDGITKLLQHGQALGAAYGHLQLCKPLQGGVTRAGWPGCARTRSTCCRRCRSACGSAA